ncbi:MAG TPA: enoyl-ACP reductase [Chthonomonadales bacterium]|nr:enoyl-ACP reductase [Chthonomonadales bacterium]
MGFLESRRILICGARNKWSISWHCALSMAREGARLAFSAYSERERLDVQKLVAGSGLEGSPVYLCDATQDDQVAALMAEVQAHFGGQLDGLLHGIAYARRDDLTGEFVTVDAEGYRIAMQSSAYSLVALTRGARPLLEAAGGGAVVTLSYLGGERVVPGYNMMGVAKAALESSVRYLANDLGPASIRVNAVSAGPIKTLAASGIVGLSTMLQYVAERAPMRRGVDVSEVGDAVAFLMSPLARGITGEVIHVDAGYHIMGM